MRAWCAVVFSGAMAVFTSSMAGANPHPDPRAVWQDVGKEEALSAPIPLSTASLRAAAVQALRVHVRWDATGDRFSVAALESEPSGTEAMLAAAATADPHGSFQATLSDPEGGQVIAHSSLGTGVAFKKLVRALSFRFPLPDRPLRLRVRAESEPSGTMVEVINQIIDPVDFTPAPLVDDVEVRSLVAAKALPRIVVNIYAEGYRAGDQEKFFRDAARTAATLVNNQFPMVDHFELQAVFAPSRLALGAPRNLGIPVPVRDSFLGLYYPYWHNFGRYYHVLYPTLELKYRRALASVPYDYALAIVDDASYWGVGNFKEVMAIPAGSSSFTYLLMHETGHYFGLNEEYEGGGPTELAFAAKMQEPWSQNITFQRTRERIKWKEHIAAGTTIPTPAGDWRSDHYGLYTGGYAQTPRPGPVFKPGLSCTMGSGRNFCRVCDEAIADRIRRDLGLLPSPH